MYTSLTLRSDDSRPGVAYLAHVKDAMGEHAEVRYAAASVPVRASAADWQLWIVDTGPVPAADPNNPDIYPLPGGLGLFIDSARDPRNQAPVVTYYDRTSGDLKLSRLDPASGQFAVPVLLDGSNGDCRLVAFGPGRRAGRRARRIRRRDVRQPRLCHRRPGRDPRDRRRRLPDRRSDSRRAAQAGVPLRRDDAGLVLPSGAGPLVVYQDATTQELLLPSAR